MEETNRPRYAFKIGQQVYRHTGAPSRGTQRTGPYMIVGLVQQDSAFFYRLSGPRGEQLAPESELKLALQPRKAPTTSDGRRDLGHIADIRSV